MDNKLIALTQQLISFPSITPNDAGCQTFIAAYLEKLGFTCEHLPFNAVQNLWACIGTGSPLFVFAGHTDVVPPGPEAAWASPPFEATIRNQTLYGRGAADMKSAMAAMIIAVENFLQHQASFTGSIAFLLTSDEEGEAIDGTAKVINILTERGIKMDYCLVGEASSEKTIADQIRIGRRGSLHGKLIIEGKQGHVAYPDLAINPIHQLAPLMTALTQMQFDQGDDHFPPTTLQITQIHSGNGAANVIPATAELKFNLRFSAQTTAEAIQQKIKHLLDLAQVNYHLKWHISAQPFITKQSKWLALVQDVITKTCGQPANPSCGGGTSDARFIAPTGAEVIELGVLNASTHQVDEHVNLADLNTLAKIYEALLQRLFTRREN